MDWPWAVRKRNEAKRWLKLFWSGQLDWWNGSSLNWAGLGMGQDGEQTRSSIWHLLSPNLEWRMNVLLNLQLQGYRCLSLQQKVGLPTLGDTEKPEDLLLCQDVAVLPSRPLLPRLQLCVYSPFSKERSIQLGPPLFILPKGSCLDNVFHSLLIEFCLFLKFNFKVVNRLNTLCLLPKVLTF